MAAWSLKKKARAAGLAFACLLLAFRLCLPSAVKHEINRQLSTMKGYAGHIDGIGISLWRGAYQIEGMAIEKKEGNLPVPFFLSPSIDIGLEWRALLTGRIVAKVGIDKGQLNFVNGPGKEQGQSGKGEDWQGVLAGLVPATINHFELHDSELHYRDPFGAPPVDVHLEALELVAENLCSRSEGKGAAMGTVSATATVMKAAQFRFSSRFDPFAPAPTFDYGLTLEGLRLSALNPLMLRYAGIDVQEGVVDFYSEAAAADAKFKGYVQPMIKGLKVMRPHESLRPGHILKKMLIGFLGWALKNQSGQVAAKIEFAGEYKDPKVSLWQAARTLFGNAFGKALLPRLQGALTIEGLPTKGKP